MREQTCCFTGHRRLTAEETAMLTVRLEETVRELIAGGVIYFGVGGAVGFDMLAAETVLRLRERFSHIRLIVVLSCNEQTAKWNAADKARLASIAAAADKVVCLQARYTPECLKARDRHLVDHSGVCVSYLTHYGGGTGYTVSYAVRQGVRVIALGER